MVVLPVCLSSVQQGYYFTFASLIGLQVFFEMGLNQVVVLLVSHEAVNVKIGEDGSLSAAPEHVNRLFGIIYLIRRWYAVAALLFFVFGNVFGFFFLNRHHQTLPFSNWGPVWVSVVTLSALNLYLSPFLAVVEGFGQLGQVSRLRLIQSIVGYTLFWILLILRADLWVSINFLLVICAV